MDNLGYSKSDKKKNIIEAFVDKLENITLNQRKFFLVLTDIFVITISMISALLLKYGSQIPQEITSNLATYIIAINSIMILSFFINHLYTSLWRFASIEELLFVIRGCIIGSALILLFFHVTPFNHDVTLVLIFLLVSMVLVGGSRFSYRIVRRAITTVRKNGFKPARVMIIGAGEAGAILIKELLHSQEICKEPVAIIDDNKCKNHCLIHGVPVVGDRGDIVQKSKSLEIDEIIIAMPSASKSEIRDILHICKQTRCKIRTLPGIYEIVDGKVDISHIRDVQIEDLLGREPVSVDLKEITGYIKDEVVLVTGGGGSIGSELCRQIATFKPKQLIILDIYENNAYEVQQELVRKYKGKFNLEVIIASIRDRNRLEEIFKTYKPAIVFHAAAHKHVPLMEKSPTEAIKNNVFGTLNVAECADKFEAKRFVLISTDKAVNPTNIMGATKRLAEMIIQSMDKHSETEFVAVRFGNVLGSNGSVIPLFKKQISEGGPVTITDPEITRYFMTIPEAVQLVIQSGAMAKGGEIFVLDMGEPVKIVDLAHDLIKLSGFEPNIDIPIKFTGLRPGEKLYEELLMEEEGLGKTSHNKIHIGAPIEVDENKLRYKLDSLRKLVSSEQRELTTKMMQEIVPTYKKVI